MSIRFGLFVPQGWRGDLARTAEPVDQFEAMVAVARTADAGPWDSIWVYDHFHPAEDVPAGSMFECWTTTAMLARETSRVNVGQMVGCAAYRNPALYAKMASTVDVGSHGRLYAGMGAGWYEREWRAYGYEWPSLGDRMGAFREAVEIVYRMWTEKAPSFAGRYHSIDRPCNEPRGARKPHPPLWIGGSGAKMTLKIAARYGDASNFAGGGAEGLRRKADLLRRHCDDVNRDYAEIVKSTSINARPVDAGAADEVSREIERAIAAGMEYFVVYVPDVAYDQRPLDMFADVIIPRFAAADDSAADGD